MWRIFVEFLSYASFICVVYIISILNRNSGEYIQAKHLRHLFLNPNRFTFNFPDITSITGYWAWLEGSFITNIAVEKWYNGRPDNSSHGFLGDRTNRLIGWATMRQLRVRTDTCQVKSTIRGLISKCYDEYSGSNEDKRSFLPGWTTNATIGNYSSSINEAFIYQTSEQLDTYIYIGVMATYRSGGYVYEFRGSLSELRNGLSQLHQLQWIDMQTRAVIIQLNLYNPSIAIFTSATIIFELISSGGGFLSARFEPLDLDAFKSIFQIVCVCIYLIFIIYFMITEIRSFIRLRKLYFRQGWSYIECGIIVCSWTGVGIHVWRTKEAARISRLFRETNGDAYINFQFLAYISDIFSFLLGFCCFFGSLRLLHLCRYNQRLNLLSNTLKRAARDLVSFSMMFAVIFLAFLTLFYLQFVSLVWECSTLLHTAQMLFELLLLKFDVTEIRAAAPVLGPIYFTLFTLFVVFICINMFVSIINDNFRRVRADVYKVHSDYHGVLSSFFRKLQKVCGVQRRNVVAVDTSQQVINVAEMADPLRRLSNRLDRLSFFINRRYGPRKVRKALNESIVKK